MITLLIFGLFCGAYVIFLLVMAISIMRSNRRIKIAMARLAEINSISSAVVYMADYRKRGVQS